MRNAQNAVDYISGNGNAMFAYTSTIWLIFNAFSDIFHISSIFFFASWGSKIYCWTQAANHLKEKNPAEVVKARKNCFLHIGKMEKKWKYWASVLFKQRIKCGSTCRSGYLLFCGTIYDLFRVNRCIVVLCFTRYSVNYTSSL